DHVADRLRTYLPATAKVEADAPGKRLLVTADHAGIEQADRVLSVLSHGQEQETRAFTLAYAGPDSVKKAIQAMLSTGVGDTWVDGRTRQLFVTDFPERVAAVAERIGQLDVPGRQVLIEARIIQVSMSDEVKT